VRQLALFVRQFSVMVAAGVPLVQCLEVLGTQAEDRRFGAVILATRSDVEAGASLAEAMRKHPKVFDVLFSNMVAAGEAGGVLDVVLTRLATYLEKAARLKGQVKAAMLYPVAVTGIAVVVVAVMLWKVIPTFAALFVGLGGTLPLPTRIVVGVSDVFVRYLPVIGCAVMAAAGGSRWYYRTPRGRVAFDRMLLWFPVVGGLARKIAVARFCRTLGTLLGSGVSILQALDVTARTAGNAVLESGVAKARRRIERGEGIAATLQQTLLFPPMVIQMIGIGERIGSLDVMLAKIADFYEEEVDLAVSGLLTVLEPLMVAVLGAVVGGIVVAMYMPMFGLISQLAGR
jgi:type IV pilus assembly protein PilC